VRLRISHVARPLLHQLAELELTPSDVGKVILSHAHFDHIGNCNLFPKSQFIVHNAELDAMFGPDFAHFAYIPELYESLRTATPQRVEGDLDRIRLSNPPYYGASFSG